MAGRKDPPADERTRHHDCPCRPSARAGCRAHGLGRCAPVSLARRAGRRDRAVHDPQLQPPGPERIREHVLLRGREVGAGVVAQLPVRVLRSARLHLRRQAADRAMGAGAQREALRPAPAQPARPRSTRRRVLGHRALPDRRPALRPSGGSRERPGPGRVPVVRGRLARQRARRRAHPAHAVRVRRRPRRGARPAAGAR